MNIIKKLTQEFKVHEPVYNQVALELPHLPAEYILCAAIRYKPAGNNKYLYIGGYRHCVCMLSLAVLTGDSRALTTKVEDQGFLTNKGRWVDRFEARKLAVAAHQVLGSSEGTLTSEDLY